MAAADYVNVYLNLYVGLDSNTMVKVRNYLQSGMGSQSSNAQNAKAATKIPDDLPEHVP